MSKTVSSDEELQRFGDWERAQWEQRALNYAASLGDLTRGSIPALLDAAAVGPGTRLLDIGTGPGFVALAAMTRQAQVRAADQSAAMVRIARTAGVDVVQASAEDLPYEDGSFDAVVGSYLLNHLPRPEVGVAELRRVLAPGGRIAMTVWDRPPDNPAIGLVSEVVAELGLTADVPAGPEQQRFADDAQAFALLAGWDDVAVDRQRWSVRVEPGSWFDVIADATPRSGAVLAQASQQARAQARERYIALALRRYGAGDGTATLPAGASLLRATKPHQ